MSQISDDCLAALHVRIHPHKPRQQPSPWAWVKRAGRSGVGSGGAAASRASVVELHAVRNNQPAGVTPPPANLCQRGSRRPSTAPLLPPTGTGVGRRRELRTAGHLTRCSVRSCAQSMRSYLWVRTSAAAPPLRRTRSLVLASRRCPPSQPPLLPRSPETWPGLLRPTGGRIRWRLGTLLLTLALVGGCTRWTTSWCLRLWVPLWVLLVRSYEFLTYVLGLRVIGRSASARPLIAHTR